jgi:hypothetical protein
MYEEELMKGNYSPLLSPPPPPLNTSPPTKTIKEQNQAKKKKQQQQRGGVGFGSGSSTNAIHKKSNDNNNNSNNNNVAVATDPTTTVSMPIDRNVDVEDSPYYREAIAYADRLQRDGVVRIDNVLFLMILLVLQFTFQNCCCAALYFRGRVAMAGVPAVRCQQEEK